MWTTLGYLIAFAVIGAPFLPLATADGRRRWITAHTRRTL